MPRNWLFAIVATGIGVTLSAQTVPTPAASFEIASIKKRDTPLQGFPRRITDRGTYSVPVATVVSLVQFAYDVRDDLIVDGPGWIRTDMFDVNAKAATDATRDEMRPMMQSLLAERFGLVVRREQRVMRHFLLVPARDDGRLGPNMLKTDNCSNPETRPAFPTLPPGAVYTGGCGTMSTIAMMASRWMRAIVIDKTGIAGTFHSYMVVSGEDMPLIPLAPSQNRPEANPNLPSYSDALRDQLGLRTESARGPVDVLAIESVHQPTEN